MVRIDTCRPEIWDRVVEYMEGALKDIQFDGEDIAMDWRYAANSRKLERELYEKYGILKDVILHPYFQYVKSAVEENLEKLDFSLFLGDPLLPFVTAVIVISMMHRRISLNALILASALIFNVNPIYVVVAMILLYFASLGKQSRRPKQFMAAPVRDASDYEGTAFENFRADEREGYDHVLIGADTSTLYTAALLAKVGHRCCVLQPLGALPVEVQPPGAPCPIPTQNANIGKVDRYQSLLDTVQNIRPPDRVKFAPVGTAADGHTHAVLRTRRSSAGANLKQGTHAQSWCFRAGDEVCDMARVWPHFLSTTSNHNYSLVGT